jgi:hypothetical protein
MAPDLDASFRTRPRSGAATYEVCEAQPVQVCEVSIPVCRSGRWKIIRIARAASIAMSAYLRWPPGRPIRVRFFVKDDCRALPVAACDMRIAPSDKGDSLTAAEQKV